MQKVLYLVDLAYVGLLVLRLEMVVLALAVAVGQDSDQR